MQTGFSCCTHIMQKEQEKNINGFKYLGIQLLLDWSKKNLRLLSREEAKNCCKMFED